jgi:hypothetical protein
MLAGARQQRRRNKGEVGEKVKKERERERKKERKRGRLARAQMRSVGGNCDELLARRQTHTERQKTGEADTHTDGGHPWNRVIT